MTDVPAVTALRESCERWVCDGYSLDIRYIALATSMGNDIFDAAVALSPLPSPRDNNLRLSLPSVAVGQAQASAVTKKDLLEIVKNAVAGSLAAHGIQLTLPRDGEYRHQLGVIDQNTWFMPLTLQVLGRAPTTLPERNTLDNTLRTSSPPFDGLDDLCAWLMLRNPDQSSLSSITITVSPPVDMRVDLSSLVGGTLRMTLHAHPNADLTSVRLAVRAVPGDGLTGRLHVADRIRWGTVVEGRLEGIVEVPLGNANGALTMLMIGSTTVRRQWFLDPAKAGTPRLAAVQQFDADLRMIRQGLFENPDSSRFEIAVAALLFLLGFSPAVQLETNSPDVIVSTPQGRLIIIECTTRVADIVTKLGKLVDRHGALVKTLQAGNQRSDVAAALVCRLPRDQIAAPAQTIRAMGVLLFASEELEEGMLRARFPSDPDAILMQALQALVG